MKYNFDKFVLSLTPKDIQTNVHYRKQCAWVLNGIDYIGRFENFDEDLKNILTEMGEADKIKHIKKHNPSKRRDIQTYLKTSGVVKRLRDLYADDFKKFGYPTLPEIK